MIVLDSAISRETEVTKNWTTESGWDAKVYTSVEIVTIDSIVKA